MITHAFKIACKVELTIVIREFNQNFLEILDIINSNLEFRTKVGDRIFMDCSEAYTTNRDDVAEIYSRMKQDSTQDGHSTTFIEYSYEKKVFEMFG